MNFIEISQINGQKPVTILRVMERINLGNVDQLEQAARLAYQQGNRNLIIDLGRVASITSAGLRAILVIYKLLGGENAKPAYSNTAIQLPEKPKKSVFLKLMHVTPEVHNVLHIAGFEDYLEIYDSEAEALASF
jgi:anti-anti-sigma regulatory factor